MAEKMQDPLVVDPANGNPRGDNSGMPNAGTARGFVNVGPDHYNADVEIRSKNRMGGIGQAADSDAMFETTPPGGGDRSPRPDESMRRGRGMGDAAHSDPAAETEHEQQQGHA